MWSVSAKIEYTDDGDTVKITDQVVFEQGKARFTSGLAQPRLSFSADGYADTMAFLERTTVGYVERLSAVNERQIGNRATYLMVKLSNWQGAMLGHAERQQDFDEALTYAHNPLRIAEQIVEEDYFTDPIFYKSFLRIRGLLQMRELSEKQPNLLEEGELEQINQELEDARLDQEVYQEAVKRSQQKTGDRKPPPPYVLSMFLLLTAQQLIAITLACSVCCGLVAITCRRSQTRDGYSLKWFSQGIIWSTSLAVSFVFFGLFPAEIISTEIQTMLFVALLWIGLALGTTGLLYWIAKRFHIPFVQSLYLCSLMVLTIIGLSVGSNLAGWLLTAISYWNGALLILAFAGVVWYCWRAISAVKTFVRNKAISRRHKFFVSALVCLLSLMSVANGYLLLEFTQDQNQQQISFPPTVWQEAESLPLKPRELKNALNLSDKEWIWAFLQWQSYHGPILSVLFAVCLLVLQCCWKWIRRTPRGWQEALRSHKREITWHAAANIAQSSGMAALIVLIICLGLTPPFVEEGEANFQVRYASWRDSSEGDREIKAIIEQIRSDEALMEDLKKSSQPVRHDL